VLDLSDVDIVLEALEPAPVALALLLLADRRKQRVDLLPTVIRALLLDRANAGAWGGSNANRRLPRGGS